MINILSLSPVVVNNEHNQHTIYHPVLFTIASTHHVNVSAFFQREKRKRERERERESRDETKRER